MPPKAVITITGSWDRVPGRLENAEAIANRKSQIRKDEGRRRLTKVFDGFGLIARFDHDMTVRFERVAHHRTQRVFVFDEEDRRGNGNVRSRRA